MLAVVRHQVHEGEAVVRRDEVHARLDASVLRSVQVGRAGNALLDIAQDVFVAFQEPADAVAVLPVPFGPTSPRGECAYLVQAAGIPGFGYQLGLAQDGVVGQRFQQRRVGHGGAVLVASQDGRQVEAEAVHVIVRHPVAQALHNHVADVRVVTVQRVATTAEVEVIPVGRQHVVRLVVDAPIGDVGTLLVAFGRVVEHDVQDDFDAIGVELLDQVLQLVGLHAEASRGSIRRLGGKEAHIAVAPHVVEHVSVDGRGLAVLKLVELVDGHELHAVDAQLLQVRDFLGYPGECARMLHPGFRAAGEVADVHFVDDQVVHWGLQGEVVFPVKVVAYYTGPVLVHILPIRLHAPDVPSGNQLGVRVHQDLRLVKAVSFAGIPRPVHPIAVFDVLEVQVEDHHREYVSHLEFFQERNLDERFRLVVVEQHQRTRRGIAGVDRKVHGISHDRGAKGVGTPRAQLQSFILVCRK